MLLQHLKLKRSAKNWLLKRYIPNAPSAGRCLPREHYPLKQRISSRSRLLM
jgi:hypothetical protein